MTFEFLICQISNKPEWNNTLLTYSTSPVKTFHSFRDDPHFQNFFSY